MGMIQVIITIWHKTSLYLLKISVRNKLSNLKIILVNPSQNLRTKIYCERKKIHVSVGAQQLYWICDSIQCSQLAYAGIP